ncbi:MaoC family dehydratase [Kordiimonas lacus]|uniref:Acyl dehydratase n=1 Tax=Kordiimonas lacus TaxID=637679 RepID=A0A1G7F236_9PROT|nr:MaoC family dehydratase [Kordiimonas lacus]SDE69959.1 Acyl dehydratase [Kordiimonas lacus]
MFRIFFEDIDVGQKDAFGSYEVTKEEVIDFASKYDPQPFHLDEEVAKQSVFGALCASGWHTCAMMMRMMVDHMKDKGLAGLGSPGIDGIEWKRPVFPGDVLSIESEYTAKRDSKSRPNLGLVKSAYKVKNQKGEVVMTMRGNAMVAKRG